MKRVLFFLLLLAVWPVAAQVTTATIGGRIVGENGPIEGVTVVAIHQPTHAQYYATTGRRGWYQLLDVLPGGPYTVRIHYFGYDPLTVRELFTYAGQNIVLDADMEAGTTDVHLDEAARSLRLGERLGGGAVPVSPLDFNLVGQEISMPVPFDVRQEAGLSGVSRLRVTPTGSNRFHGSAYGYSGGFNAAGLTLATPVAGEDYQLFAGLQYAGPSGFSGAGRFDACLGNANRLELTGGLLDGENAWAAAGMTTQLNGGAASNRAQAGWYGTPDARRLVVTDDFTVAAGSQRLLMGVQAAHFNERNLDSTATRVDFYVQDVVRLGKRMTLLAGLRFSFLFAFSPRVSLYYDLSGDNMLVLRAGTAIYGVHGEGTVWKNLAAIDTRLPGKFLLTLEGIYGQTWRRAFYISSWNVLDSHYALTAQLERPLADNFWAVASYTRSGGDVRDRVIGGFSYRMAYLGGFATSAALLYGGCPGRGHTVEARLTQDLGFGIGGRDQVLQITGYLRHDVGNTWFLAGIRYLL